MVPMNPLVSALLGWRTLPEVRPNPNFVVKHLQRIFLRVADHLSK